MQDNPNETAMDQPSDYNTKSEEDPKEDKNFNNHESNQEVAEENQERDHDGSLERPIVLFCGSERYV